MPPRSGRPQRPKPARWRAYFDGSYNHTHKRMTMGAIILAPNGEVRLRRLSVEEGGNNNIAEALAALLAIVALREISGGRPPKRWELIGDNQSVIALLSGTAHTRRNSYFGEIIAECRLLMGQPRLIWVPRGSNRAADQLAARGSLMAVGSVSDKIPLWQHERRQRRRRGRRRRRRRALAAA